MVSVGAAMLGSIRPGGRHQQWSRFGRRTFVREDHRLSITVSHYAQVDRFVRVDVPAGMPGVGRRAPKPGYKGSVESSSRGFLGQ